MSVQRKADRLRKGSVIVVDTEHSYNTQPNLERHVYRRVQLDRIVATVADSRLGRRVTKTERLGDVNVTNTPSANIFILDADVRAEDLWRDHADSSWSSTAEAKPIISQYKEES